MNGEARHREPGLVEVYKKAWAATPDVKILQAFEMRRGYAAKPARARARGAVAPSAPTPTRPTRSSARSSKFRIIEIWGTVYGVQQLTTTVPHESQSITPCALGTGLYIAPLYSSIGT